MYLRIAALARAGALAVMLLICPALGLAQTTYSEDFTGTTSNNQWFFYNGACLTAGSGTLTTSPGYIPGCTTILSTYYYPILNALGKTGSDSYLTGGDLGFLGSSTAPSIYTAQVPDSAPVAGNGNSGGALRFTNGKPYGYHENGAIVSNFVFPTNQGLQITFKTVTYEGDNQGGHGADGISFYLLDGCMPIAGGTLPSGCGTSKVYGTGNSFSGIGAWGGSLAYTCSNANLPYDGLAGGYLGLGIDEWGNFLNGTSNTLGESGTSATGDNTASGGGYQPGRIGLRGPGNITWRTLNTAYGTWEGASTPYYPASLTTSCYINGGTLSGGLCSGRGTDAMMAVQKTCANGTLYNFANNSGSVTSSSVTAPKNDGAAALSNNQNTAGILDYTALTNGYKVVSGFSIANESATRRGSTLVANTSSADANPITYKLKITPDNLLSLSYSYNGGSWQPVISGQDITASNGSLPDYFRFGFAGSTGGSTNIHEVMCFKAAPAETSNSSGGVNVYQNPTVKTGTQLYLAYYNPNDWTGQLTATPVLFDTTNNVVTISPTPTWDARCVLTGVNKTTGPCSTGQTSLTAEGPTSRVMLTWSGSAGIPFEWASITSGQQTALDAGDSAQTTSRLDFLRGDRTNELNSAGTCPQLTGSNALPCFRSRNSVLGDIVDSSPTWIGPPQTYSSSIAFKDTLYNTMGPEQNVSYQGYINSKQGRLNVVYVGSNDGFIHGFRAGTLDANGNMVVSASTPNDGYEVLAYMPGAVLNTIHSSTAEYDYANQLYSHQWFVDATPATGDLFYQNAWHTWLAGGLGPGGAAFYALDVTDPSTFSEANASNIVVGEWTPSTITCQNVSNCGQFMGSTFGTPIIRRFHNGSWGVIFGNGYNSTQGTAGIFIMLIDPSSGVKTFYYLASGSSTKSNGIANPASLDMDLDHVIDYIYGGDLQGNVWRWDVTDKNPANWALSANQPLFTTPNNQPITAGLTVGTYKMIKISSNGLTVLDNSFPERVIIGFGTGQQTPQSLTNSTQYATGQQYLFGIWDWNFSIWNNTLKGLPQAVIPSSPPSSIGMTQLMQQTITTVPASPPALSYRTVSNNYFCYAAVGPVDTNNCSLPGTYYGWYIPLPAPQEQVIFNPLLSPDGEFVVNTLIPIQDTPLSCNAAGATTGFTMGVTPDTGGGQSSGTPGSPTGYFKVNTTNGVIGGEDGIQLNGTGIPMFLSSGQKGDNNSEYVITQTSSGSAPPIGTNRHVIVTGKRINWVQRR